MFDRRQITFGLSALGAAMSPLGMLAEGKPLKLAPDLLSRLDERFAAGVEKEERAGYSILIRQANETVYENGIGWADIATQRPVTPETRFRLASLTKPITSAAAMILVEEARLRLSDPLWLYIPEFREAEVAVSVREDGTLETEPARRAPTVSDLMSHTAGILGRIASPVTSAQVYKDYSAHFFDSGSVADTARRIATLPLVAHPGEAWTYGLFATDVLGRIIEVASGVPLDEFVQSRILNPLGMNRTSYLRAGQEISDLATAYRHTPSGALEPVPLHNLDHLPATSGGGGLASTPGDYARFASMLLNGGRFEGERLLSPTSVALMSRNALPEALLPIELDVTVPAAGFGLGLGTCVGTHMLPHSPLYPGDFWWAGSTDTYFVASPRHQMLGIIMSQYDPTENTKSWRTWTDFTSILYGTLA